MKQFAVLNTTLHTNSNFVFSLPQEIDMEINFNFIELFETEEVNYL